MPIVDFISESYESRSRDVSSTRALNLYPQIPDSKTKAGVILVGTPGTTTFTRQLLQDVEIASIAGDGSTPNVVTVITSQPHGYSIGQVINIEGTASPEDLENGNTRYNQLEVVISFIVGPNTFTYQTVNNTETDVINIGNVNATGESPITGIPENTACRGIHITATGRLFGVFADTVYEFFGNGTWNNVGQKLGDSPNFVSMADDGRSLVIVDGLQYYVLDLATDTSQIIDTDAQAGFENPIKVKFLNQRIIITNNDSDNDNRNKFFWTDILDATTINPLGFASGESSADPINTIEVIDGELWVFGPRSYEVWRIDSNPDLPYSKVGGSSTDIGCAAPNSSVDIAGKVFWLGSSTAGTNIIYMSDGYAARRISNHALEYQLGKLGVTSDAVFFTYQQEGHTWLVCTFLTAQRTWKYDLTSGMWSEASTKDKNSNKQKNWEPLFAVTAFGKVVAASGETARLFTLDLDKYTEYDGRPIVREFTSPVYYQDYRECFHKDFQIDLETGVGIQFGLPATGIQTNQGENPQIMLQYSDDGGHTFSSERWTSMGKIGQYRSKCRWRNLGRSSERVYKFKISDPVKCVIIGARILMDISRNR